jgi:hypothetical protein
MGKRWERFGDNWIDMRFRSKMDNIFILEKEGDGTTLYLFDDGPEIPTTSIDLAGDEEKRLRDGIEERKQKNTSVQEICEFLFGYFPDYRDYWKKVYGEL